MKRYEKEDAYKIISDHCDGTAEIRDNGVWLSDNCLRFDTSQQLHWKYFCDLDDSNAPNPLVAPCLPIPFSANELAAFMLDGIGAFIVSAYGGWEHGPDKKMLNAMGILAHRPREALCDAFAAYRKAEEVVGPFPHGLETRAWRLVKVFTGRNDQANSREGVFAKGISIDESNKRRRLAKISLRKIRRRKLQALKKFDAASAAWRKTMVNQLLHPHPEVTKVKSSNSAAGVITQIEPELSNWKMKVQAEATARFLRLYKCNASPSVSAVKDDLARWCRENNITTQQGIFPSGEYLRAHVLSGKHWKKPPRPDYQVEQAKPAEQAEQAEQAEHITVEQTAQSSK